MAPRCAHAPPVSRDDIRAPNREPILSRITTQGKYLHARKNTTLANSPPSSTHRMRSNTLVSQLQDKRSKSSPCPQHPMGTLPISYLASVFLLVLEFGFPSHRGRPECTANSLFNNTLYGHDATPGVPHPYKVGTFRLGDRIPLPV